MSRVLYRIGGAIDCHPRVRHPRRGSSKGITLIEILVVVSIVGVLLAVLLPAVQNAREAARRSQCENQLKQLALGIHNYEAAFGVLPMQGGGTAERHGVRTLPDDQCNHHRLNYAVAILPFVEQQSLWEAISTTFVEPASGKAFPAMGPVPWYNILSASQAHPYLPWNQPLAILRCPSDPATPALSGAINYAACMGDGVRQLGCALGKPQYRRAGDMNPQRYDDSTKRGIFANWKAFGLRDCTDGLSATLLLGEIAVGQGDGATISHMIEGRASIEFDALACRSVVDPKRPRFFHSGSVVEARGLRWADSGLTFSCFSTVLPPMSPSCAEIPASGADANWFGGIFSAGSHHAGGVYVAMVDGSIRFVTSSVNAQSSSQSAASVYEGNALQPPGSKSPFGVWGALGTRGSSEMTEEF